MMKRTIIVGVIGLAVAFCAVVQAAEKAAPSVKYPEGYRVWTHVKSAIIQEGHKLYDTVGGIHHVYGNKKALEAMKKGQAYPDGSVFVFDLLTPEIKDNAVTEGPKKFIGVMEKNAKKFPATGGWGFERFKGDTKERMVKEPGKCFGCHEPEKKSDYVFSKFRK